MKKTVSYNCVPPLVVCGALFGILSVVQAIKNYQNWGWLDSNAVWRAAIFLLLPLFALTFRHKKLFFVVRAVYFSTAVVSSILGLLFYQGWIMKGLQPVCMALYVYMGAALTMALGSDRIDAENE